MSQRGAGAQHSGSHEAVNPMGAPGVVGRLGLGVALATPFRDDGRVDDALLVAHASSLVARGCSQVALFGTTGEGASVDVDERSRVLFAFAAQGFDLRRHLLAGVWANAVGDAIAQARGYLDAGVRGLLLPPPFYFKGIDGEGAFRWFAAVIEGLGARARDIVLYDIPQLTAVDLPTETTARLRATFPEVVVAIKYSSDDRAHVGRLLAIDPRFAVVVGDETLLAGTVRTGGAGAISGLANLIPERLLPLATRGEDDPAMESLVRAVCAHPVTPAIKALLAHATGNERWRRVAPPLVELGAAQSASLVAEWEALLGARR